MSAEKTSREVVDLAVELGATAAGLASLEQVCAAPSARAAPAGSWPSWARSVLVLGLEHPPADPALDWWDDGPGGTPGNRQLQRLAAALVSRLGDSLSGRAKPLPYHVERGGLFLKDAAVVAGLGAYGKNNLVLHPRYGARLRFKAVLLGLDASPVDDLAPLHPACDPCAAPCAAACPQAALTDGRYRQPRCALQMALDEQAARQGGGAPAPVRYCRACELACPVGNGSK